MLTVFNTPEELARGAAAQIARWLRRGRADFHLALSGGGTPARLFALLAGADFSGLPWQRVQVYWCDERCVPPEDPESNYGQARRLLLDHLPLLPERIHPIPGHLPPEQAVEGYTETLLRHAAPGLAWPRLDLALLGLGEDGHTASLFPGTPQAQQPVIAVQADYQGRPAMRVTLTPLVFNHARRVVFLVSGASKAQALAHSLRGAPDALRWPAQRIRPARGRVFWWADRAAAQAL